MLSALLDESGVTTVEYALLLGIVCVAAYIGAWATFGSTVTNAVSNAREGFTNVLAQGQ